LELGIWKQWKCSGSWGKRFSSLETPF